jgi:DNA-directed RNA polymerase
LLDVSLNWTPNTNTPLVTLLVNEDVGANTDTLMKVIDAQTTSGYIINEKIYDTLIKIWDDGTVKLIETGQHWHYAVDQIWKSLQPKSKWYAFTKRIGKQRPSFSDTSYSSIWADYKNA